MKIVKMHNKSAEDFDNFLQQKLSNIESHNLNADENFAKMTLPSFIEPPINFNTKKRFRKRTILLLLLLLLVFTGIKIGNNWFAISQYIKLPYNSKNKENNTTNTNTKATDNKKNNTTSILKNTNDNEILVNKNSNINIYIDNQQNGNSKFSTKNNTTQNIKNNNQLKNKITDSAIAKYDLSLSKLNAIKPIIDSVNKVIPVIKPVTQQVDTSYIIW